MYTRDLSSPSTLSLLQFSAPSLQWEAGPFQTAGRAPAVLWEVLWSHKLSQGGSALTRADRAADLIFSSFTAFLEFSSKLLGPLAMGSLGANAILRVREAVIICDSGDAEDGGAGDEQGQNLTSTPPHESGGTLNIQQCFKQFFQYLKASFPNRQSSSF